MDKRALILDRLFAVLQGIPPQLGYKEHSVFRNRGLLQVDKQPSILLLDGSEEISSPISAGLNRGRIFMTPCIMTLLPLVFVLLEQRKTPSNEGVAEELSTFRNAVITAVANDKELAMLCGPNGGVVLRRVETDMQPGSPLWGELKFDFAFNFVLDPYQLPDGSDSSS